MVADSRSPSPSLPLASSRAMEDDFDGNEAAVVATVAALVDT